MTKRLLSFVILFGMNHLFAQTTFQETIGGSRNDVPTSITINSDSGYFISGYTERFTYAWQKDMLFMRLDKNGDTLWSRSFGGVNSEEAMCGKQVQSGFTCVGTTCSYRYNTADFNLFISTTDNAGNWQMSSHYGYASNNMGANDFVELSNGNLVVLAHSEAPGNINTRDIFLMQVKLPFYDTVWVKRYAILSGADWGYSLEQTHDGGFIIAGETQSSAFHSGMLIKTDSVGNIQWSKTVPTDAWQGMPTMYFSCRQTQDHGYIVAGETWNNNGGNMEILLLKLDSAGNALWSESIRPQSVSTGCLVYPTSIEELNDGGFIISSIFTSANAMDDNYVVRTDSAGHVLWSMRYGGPNNERLGAPANNVQQFASGTRSWIAECLPVFASPSTYVLTSFTNSFVPSSNMQDIYVVKIQEGGLSGCNDMIDSAVVTPLSVVPNPFPITAVPYHIFSSSITPPGSFAPALPRTLMCSHPIGMEENNVVSFVLFPNPTADQITIQHPDAGYFQFTVANALGETVMSGKQYSEVNTIDVSGLPAGVYFLTLQGNGSNGTQKFVKR